MATRKGLARSRKELAADSRDRAEWGFAQLLAWHLDRGTRPEGKPDRPGRSWGDAMFAHDIGGMNERSVRNWRTGSTTPTDIGSLEVTLFGDNEAYEPWREEFRAAWSRARRRGDAGATKESPAQTKDTGARRDQAGITAPDRCLGRDAEIAGLVATLTAPRPGAVVVLGGPGMGKTTLTRAVATHYDVMARFAERRWFVALETALDAASVRTAVVLALGGNPADAAAFDHALAMLGAAPALLVLDNLETPYDADTAATRDTLRRLIGVPSVTLLCSYRGHTAPAAPAFPHQPVMPPLPSDAARRLFLELAPRIRPDDPHLELFLDELGGVPLAIELVALRAAPHDALAELWDDWQRLGVALARDPDLPESRTTSLARSIDLSWESSRLHDEGRALFRLLGALPAGMALADRVALLGDDATEAARQVLAIGLAVSRDGRLDLLPPVRSYAQAATPPGAQATDCWCRHYLALAQSLGDRAGTAGSGALIERLKPEVANLEAAFAAALIEALRSAAVDAGYGHHILLRFTGLGRTAALAALADACRQAGDVLGEANCIGSLGDIALARSDHAAARALYEQARPLYQQVGDVRGEANCIVSLGEIALRRSDHAASQALYEQARPLFQQVGDVLGEANCILSLGEIALRRSDHEAARALYEQARPLYQQVGAVLGEANCIKSLGDIALRRSDHAAAQALYEQARPLFQQVGDVLGEANCIKSLGDIALRRSDHAAARALYEQARPLFQQIGDVLGEANCISAMGDVARSEGDAAAAVAPYTQALALYEQLHHTQNVALGHEDLARVMTAAERAGHVAAARAAWTAMDLPEQVARLDKEFG
jgi:tetratricopeptide (TPR) repeat protein